jgi:hypothetical protein
MTGMVSGSVIVSTHLPLLGKRHTPGETVIRPRKPEAGAQETLADMARSVFCAAPPGQTQDSVRVFRAIIKGCIPVTMYRGNDRPFERHLLLPWDSFSVNLQPDDYDQINRVLQVYSSH